eukprot:CAMPEP_0182909232 /NCGR_PEP_ID=MMETSP0034_2-20130328/35642_1 /TAXON_ID=156128 /ORGANISM="Nephroselmis pyriformis, Strain CCMP717" /LENGTH=165 /DNA_ID=CAMNT_0025045473 /DNA_START=245 /DNA_END=738 /DNA_ORIENTATION=-
MSNRGEVGAAAAAQPGKKGRGGAKGKGSAPQLAQGAGTGSQGPPDKAHTVYLSDMPGTMTKGEILTHFARYGAVVAAAVATDSLTGACRGFGSVDFGSKAAADAVLAARWHQIGESRVEARKTDSIQKQEAREVSSAQQAKQAKQAELARLRELAQRAKSGARGG